MAPEPDGVSAGAPDVSRETRERLRAFEALVKKWSPRINLVSPRSLEDLWSRHILDSAQLFELADRAADLWADLGSGGGFPGFVCAILARDTAPQMRFVLVESDRRKAAFLLQASRELDLDLEVISERVENLAPLGADVLSARALAPLDQLLPMAERHLKPGGSALFPKGATYRQEMKRALEKWAFRSEVYPSKTNEEAAVLKLGDIRRV